MRIAYFSPVTPRRSGIADYSEALLRHLAAHAEVDLFLEDYAPADDEIRARFRWRHWSEFEADYRDGRYDAVLYHIGNNPQHVYIYDLALRFPGVIVLHEFNLHYLMAEVTIVRGDWDGYLRELEYNAGPEALIHGQRVRLGETAPEYDRIAMNRRLLETSRAAIVHSDYMRGLIRQAGFTLPITRIPHGVAAHEVEGSAARARLGLDHQPVAGSFGFLKPYKRIHSAIRALARLSRSFPNAHLLLAGEEHPHYPLRPLIAQLGLSGRVHLAGFLPLDDFYRYIAASDICLNLRFPTVGESSGSLLREMAVGKPVIVSDLGSFSELPDDACLKIPAVSAPESAADSAEVEWLAECLAALWNSPSLRDAIGERARAYAHDECSWEHVAAKYAKALSSVHSGVDSDVDSGVDSENVGPGFSRAAGHSVLNGGDRRLSPWNPDGPHPFDRADLCDYILSWTAENQALKSYVQKHLHRFVRTIEITPPAASETAGILEMGCYMQMTQALRRFLGYHQVRGCYYGPAGRIDHKTTHSATGETFTCSIDLFDAEKDRFPYDDESFDTVLCCELVEHLYFDPMHMMSEINRIVRPGGHIVLTTPNTTGLRALCAVLYGYHPGVFHAYVVPDADGEAGARHNREYAPRDVKALLEKAGFTLKILETGWLDLEPDEESRFFAARDLLRANGYADVLRGDIIYALGQKAGPVVERYPIELYTSF